MKFAFVKMTRDQMRLNKDAIGFYKKVKLKTDRLNGDSNARKKEQLARRLEQNLNKAMIKLYLGEDDADEQRTHEGYHSEHDIEIS